MAEHDLCVTALSVVVMTHENYQPVDTFPPGTLPARRIPAAVPAERLMVLAPQNTETDGPGVSALALAALGAPAPEEALFLVHADPPRDTLEAPLARLVHETGWSGEELGITHLDELGGTVVFDLLGWAVPDSGATVLICDEPLLVDARLRPVRFTAVGLRVRRGAGPLRVLGCGEGAPGPDAEGLRFTGSGPCDAWLALHAALADGRIADGESVLLHAKGPLREGWLSVRVEDVAGLRLAGDAGCVASGSREGVG